MDLNLPKASVAAVDEAAIKLDPILKAAIDHALSGLRITLESILVGRTIVITIK